MPSCRYWLVCLCMIICLMGAVGAYAQSAGANADPAGGASPGELDEAALAEIERLRLEVERLLSTVPSSLHDQVRELLLAPTTSVEAAPPEVPGASISSTSINTAEAVPSEAVPSEAPEVPAPEVTGISIRDDAAVEAAEPGSSVAERDSPRDSVTPEEVRAGEVAEAVTEPSKQQGPTPQARRQSRRPTCNSLDPLDENGDGKINAQDRYWRYLYVWIDHNRDGQRQEKEVESVYAAGVREIANGLGIFYRKKGSVGEIRRGHTLLLDLAGNGFGSGRRPDDGVLMVDADGLGRGDGPQVLDADGAEVTGIEPFVAGWQMRLADGQILTLNCPGGGLD